MFYKKPTMHLRVEWTPVLCNGLCIGFHWLHPYFADEDVEEEEEEDNLDDVDEDYAGRSSQKTKKKTQIINSNDA